MQIEPLMLHLSNKKQGTSAKLAGIIVTYTQPSMSQQSTGTTWPHGTSVRTGQHNPSTRQTQLARARQTQFQITAQELHSNGIGLS
jgi:hypothetical protein